MSGVFAFLRSCAWLAAIAFMAGFLSYLAVGGATRAVAAQDAFQPITASFPASDDWNLPKHI